MKHFGNISAGALVSICNVWFFLVITSSTCTLASGAAHSARYSAAAAAAAAAAGETPVADEGRISIPSESASSSRSTAFDEGDYQLQLPSTPSNAGNDLSVVPKLLNLASQRGLVSSAEANDWVAKISHETSKTQGGGSGPLARHDVTVASRQDLKAQLLYTIIARATQSYAAKVGEVEYQTSKIECLWLTTMALSMAASLAFVGFCGWEFWAIDHCLQSCRKVDCRNRPIFNNSTWCTSACPSSACPPPNYPTTHDASFALIGPAIIIAGATVVLFIVGMRAKFSVGNFKDRFSCGGCPWPETPPQRGFFPKDLIQAIVDLARLCPNAEEALAPLQPFR